MRDPVRPVKAGEIVVFTQGIYSDFGLSSIFRAAKDFDPRACLNEWRREVGNGNEEFVPFLSRKGYIADEPYHELWIEEYTLKARYMNAEKAIDISAFGFPEQES